MNAITADAPYAREVDLLTVAEAAMLLRCSAWTVRRRIHAGEIPAYRTGGPGTPLRIKRSELTAWFEQPEEVQAI